MEAPLSSSDKVIDVRIIPHDFDMKIFLASFAVTIGCAALAVLIQKSLGQPDFARTWKMRAYSEIGMIANTQIKAWQTVSKKATEGYTSYCG